MRDPEKFADMVVMTVKSALAPVLERLAVSEQSNRDLQARVLELSGLRDRLTTVEVKAAIPSPVVELPDPVDLGPVIERVTALETRLVTLDVRDRLASVESKQAQPVAPVVEPAEPVDLSPVLERLASVEGRLSTLGDVRDRVAAVEIKSERPASAPPEVLDRLTAVETRITATELRYELKSTETGPLMTSLAELAKDFGAIRERVAVVEVRGQVPGPAGKDGVPGKDGVDGLGFDDLTTVQNDDRSFTVKVQRGDRVKDIGTLKFPVQIQRGVYIEGKSYEHGDLVTWGGSQWHCDSETTTKPGDGSKAWTLVVKRGRDGKDGADARTPVAVVTLPKDRV